jgi:bacterioferritin-associated ferredoxin
MKRSHTDAARTPLPSVESRCPADGNAPGCSSCTDCSVGQRFVCRCLQVTEADVLRALSTFAVRTVRELRKLTGAGDGCTACHRLLARYLDRFAQSSLSSSAEPICSVR